MKLHFYRHDRPGFLSVAPLLDVLLLLFVFLLLNSTFVVRSGVKVALPTSQNKLPPISQPHLITITAGTTPQIFLDAVRVELEDLGEELGKIESVEKNIVLMADEKTTHGIVIAVSNRVLQAGFDLVLATDLKEN